MTQIDYFGGEISKLLNGNYDNSKVKFGINFNISLAK